MLALPALYLPQWSGWIWPALGAARLFAWQGAATKLLLSAAVIFPPAFCMGMVLPLMARAVLRGQFHLARHGVWLYAINTLGGVLGLGTVSLLTLHLVGAGGSMLLAIALNLLVAVGCLALDTRCPPTASADDAACREQAVFWPIFLPALAVAGVSGTGILAFEVLALQLVALAAPLSFYAPTAVLTVVVLLLGLAALVVPWLITRVGGPQQVISTGLLGAAICIVTAPLFFFQLVQWVDLGPKDTLFMFVTTLLSVTLVALGPAVLLAGLVFPAVLGWLGAVGQDPYGRRWGWLLAVNGLGGLLGAEATYRFLLPAVGVHQAMGIVAIFYAVAALAWALLRSPRTVRSLAWPLGLTATIVVTTLGPLSWLPLVNPAGVLIVDQRSGREGTVAVVDSPNMGRRIVMSNQYVLGGTKFRYDQERLTHLPLVLHPDPRRVACIGLATGITPGAALEHTEVAGVTAVELSPLVVLAADQHFGSFNHDITRSHRALVVVEDARTYLAASPGEFDVVVGDLLLPWAAGEARLYSVEHFRSVRAALRAGGVFCQWLAAYQLTPEHFDMIRDTFCQVFPRAYLFRNTFDCRYPALALVGLRDGELDWSTIGARCEALRRQGDVRDPLMRHVEGVGMLYLGTTQDAGGPVNTLANMRLELAAGRRRVTRQLGAEYLSGENWLQFVQERYLSHFQEGSEHTSDVALFQLAQLGQQLSIWEALRQYNGPLSPEDRAPLPAARQAMRGNSPRSFVPTAMPTGLDGPVTRRWCCRSLDARTAVSRAAICCDPVGSTV